MEQDAISIMKTVQKKEDITEYVTQQECEDRRNEFREELNGQNLRLTILETNMHTISIMLKSILGAILSTSGVIFATLLVK